MFGFRPLIKIPGKSRFDELNPEEFSVLIDSFLAGGNDSFDKDAFNEFLRWKLKDPLARRVQAELNRNTFLPSKGRRWPEVNEAFLKEFAGRLKEGRL